MHGAQLPQDYELRGHIQGQWVMGWQRCKTM